MSSKILQFIYRNKFKSLSAISALTLLLLSGRYLKCKLYRYIYSLPPGPEGIIPLIGYSINTILSNNWHINNAINYGSIVYLQSFFGATVLINDSQIAKQLFIRKEFQNRRPIKHDNFELIGSKDNDPSFASLNGKEWLKGRQSMQTNVVRMLNTKFVNQIFKKNINNKLKQDLNDIINNRKGIWYPREIMQTMTFNTIYQANFGKDINNDNIKMLKGFKNDISTLTSSKVAFQFVLFLLFPFLSSSFMSASWEIIKVKNRLHDNIRYLIDKRVKEIDENNKIVNKDDMTFIDYTMELRKNNKINEGREIADILIMFGAATDTTALTAEYGVVLLAKYIEIQNKVRNELKSVLQTMNINDSSDILYDINLLLKLPLFRAFIHEVLRISNVAKIGSPRYVSHEIKINNYIIPKGTTFFINIDYIHNYNDNENWKNKQYGKNGKEICLENWLNDDETQFIVNESFVVFGSGKRDCPGQQLALKELRILFGYLLLNYSFKLQNTDQKIMNVGGIGTTASKIVPEIPVIINKIL